MTSVSFSFFPIQHHQQVDRGFFFFFCCSYFNVPLSVQHNDKKKVVVSCVSGALGVWERRVLQGQEKGGDSDVLTGLKSLAERLLLGGLACVVQVSRSDCGK